MKEDGLLMIDFCYDSCCCSGLIACFKILLFGYGGGWFIATMAWLRMKEDGLLTEWSGVGSGLVWVRWTVTGEATAEVWVNGFLVLSASSWVRARREVMNGVYGGTWRAGDGGVCGGCCSNLTWPTSVCSFVNYG